MLKLAPVKSSASSRTRALAGVAVAAALGGALVAAPQLEVHAQQRSDAQTVQTPFGRAPLTFADIVEKVKPAVVSIHVTNGGERTARRLPRQGAPNTPNAPTPPGGRVLPDLPDDHPLNEFFRNLPREFGNRGGTPNAPTPRPSLAQGSGFVISADGYVVTNNHVIDGASKISVSFDRDNKFDAELIGTDPRTDVALLKIKPSKPDQKFDHVRFAAKEARVGDWVIAVGNPFGLGGTVTAGIVSASGRDIGSGPYDYIQIDAAVNRGNSGGPTFNLDGEVIGVNTAIYSPSGGNVGIAFAIPAKTADEVVSQLRSKGTVSRGWLGVKIENVNEDTASSLGLANARGALVSEITAGGPAAASQLRAGDAIVSVNGVEIRDSRDLARKIAEFAPDTTVRIEVMRFGKSETVPVKLGTFPANPDVAMQSQKPTAKPEATPTPTVTELDQLGLSLTTVTAKAGETVEGVAISDVKAGSDAAGKGLKSGDVILEVQGQKVANAADVEAGVKKAKSDGRRAVLLRVKSGDVLRFIAVQLKAG
ncbi:MAG: Do family serine endopeptidase [Hyphomicrobium sp.]|uniref:Do family serine endopeptidase n=1 Tax=Hyphomicrobium sp. CS1BSMeth3 TaxID=1892844 RepID=UPI000930321C|nr:Do family serine endopeptidase [Hyphomicrobium sp. CS1BSMeth3]MBN9267862.1 Do family serine endopeptidase [Hyphomicrobium sp.]MBN9278722.1 Do family serine endopeptidase [Hyphomicrobium sp.]